MLTRPSRRLPPRFRVAAVLALGAGAAAPAASAQGLTLVSQGGSLPGSLQLEMASASFGTPAAILLSANAGPTPLSLLDPRDSRVLLVGTDFLGLAFGGIFGLDGHFRSPTIPVPNLPGLVDAALHFHGFSVGGTTTLVNQLSNPAAVRFAPAGAFRNRQTFFTQPRAFFPMLPTADGRWMIAGGGVGALLAQLAQRTTEIYDPVTDQFTPGPNLTSERALHTATELQDGRWLLTAGVNVQNDPQNTAEVWDPVARTFTAVASMQDKRMGHSATLLADGRVFVAGGLSDMNAPSTPLDPIYSALTSTEIWNPATSVWTKGPAMTVPRAGHVAVPLPDGRVLLAGGIGYTTFIIKIPTIFKDTDIYDPATNTITKGPPMGTGRAVLPYADLGNGRYLLAGGISNVSLATPGTPTATAEIYDAAGNRWLSAGQMATARGLHAVFPLDGGRFLHVGGADGTIFQPNALASTEVYDAGTNAWSAGPPLNASRAGFGCFLTPMGQYHVLGGGSGMGASVVHSTEWYYR